MGNIEEIFCKSNRVVRALTDNIDKINLSITKTAENQQHSGNEDLGDNVMRDITNSQPSPEEQGIWQRRARHQVVENTAGNIVSYEPTKKRQLKGGGQERAVKKNRDELLDHFAKKEPRQAEVGDCQPRRSL